MTKLFKRTIYIFICIVVYQSGYSQSTGKTIHTREQLWFGYFKQTRITNKVGLWLDVQYRLTDNFAERPFQFIVRPALNFYIKDNLRVQTGYAYISHFPAEGLETRTSGVATNLVESEMQWFYYVAMVKTGRTI